MGKKDEILLIASGMKKAKKEFLKNKVENIYLNYGLLGLGSVLFDKGYKSVKMFQGDDKKITDLFIEIEEAGIHLNCIEYPVLISIPSFFSVPWALEFIQELKKRKADVKIILGGRWVLDENLEWCKQKFSMVDFFCLGCPDDCIDELLFPKNWIKFEKRQIYNKPFKKFHFEILNNYKSYQPVIEVSRGCGRGCDFCLEKNYPVSETKLPIDIIKEAIEICKIYKDDELNFYFEASIFNPTVEWAEEFFKYYKFNNMKFKWRFETRVDTVNIEALKILAKAGLKVIDLGLESASKEQLIRMKKCKNPEEYLMKAEKLLEVMKQVGIWSKLNILLYIGETLDTIRETRSWLDKQRDKIIGLSVNPIIVYLNGPNTGSYVEYINVETKSKVNVEALEKNGYTFIDLSDDITYTESEKITNDLLDTYMLPANYHRLKEICYTKRT